MLAAMRVPNRRDAQPIATAQAGSCPKRQADIATDQKQRRKMRSSSPVASSSQPSTVQLTAMRATANTAGESSNQYRGALP